MRIFHLDCVKPVRSVARVLIAVFHDFNYAFFLYMILARKEYEVFVVESILLIMQCKLSLRFRMQLDQVCTIPLDTAKVRLQLQKSAIAGDVTLPKYRGLLGTVGTIAREEGLRSLWKGVVPGLHRQCLFGGLRIGMYEPVSFKFYFFLALTKPAAIHRKPDCCFTQVKNLYVGKDHVGDVPLSKKILAGLTTGERSLRRN